MAYTLNFMPGEARTSLGPGISGAKALFYQEGTTTPVTVYTDDALTTPAASPLVADSNGLFAQVYHDGTVGIKAVVTDASDVTLWTIDPALSGAGLVDLTSTKSFTDLASSFRPTTGSSTAYVLDTGTSLTAQPTGIPFPVRFHTECGDDPTINVDTLGAVDLRMYRRDGSLGQVKDKCIEANATLWLRYDGTDYIVLGGQGFRNQEHTDYAVKTSDESRASVSSNSADSDLSLVVSQPGYYQFECFIIHNAGAGQFKFRISNPASGTVTYQVDEGKTVYDGTSNTQDTDSSATDRATTVRGLLEVTASTGVSLSWSQLVSDAANTTVKANSYIKVTWMGASA